jgi:hypothetical protein
MGVVSDMWEGVYAEEGKGPASFWNRVGEQEDTGGVHRMGHNGF